MSDCIDLSAGQVFSEICFKHSSDHVFAYYWRVDHSTTPHPVGEHYICGVAVYRKMDITRAESLQPIQQHRWLGHPDLWTTDVPSPCEVRDGWVDYIEKHPEFWVEHVISAQRDEM
jgi:hypothetical protein